MRILRRRASALTFTAALAAVGLLAGCGTSGPGGSSSTPGPSGSPSASSIPAAKELPQLKAAVASAAKLSPSALSSFSPGPAVKNPSALKGKRILALPGTSEIPTCAQDMKVIKSIGDAAGTPVTIFHDSGKISQWETAINTAIAQHYAAVDFMCDDPPSLIAPVLKKAKKAGVKVFAYALVKALNSQNYPGVAGGMREPSKSDYLTMVKQVFVHTGGKPVNALIITSKAVTGNKMYTQDVKNEFQKLCGSACHLSTVNVQVPDWGTKIQPTVTSQLLKHPDINMIFPMFSGEYSFVLPGIKAAHRSNVFVTGAFGNGVPQIKLEINPSTSKTVIGDTSSYPVWAAYELYYQTALGLSGQQPQPLSKTITPNILTTPQNAQQVLSGAAWGDQFVNTYRKLLGLPPLSGAALKAAAAVGNQS